MNLPNKRQYNCNSQQKKRLLVIHNWSDQNANFGYSILACIYKYINGHISFGK